MALSMTVWIAVLVCTSHCVSGEIWGGAGPSTSSSSAPSTPVTTTNEETTAAAPTTTERTTATTTEETTATTTEETTATTTEETTATTTEETTATTTEETTAATTEETIATTTEETIATTTEETITTTAEETTATTEETTATTEETTATTEETTATTEETTAVTVEATADTNGTTAATAETTTGVEEAVEVGETTDPTDTDDNAAQAITVVTAESSAISTETWVIILCTILVFLGCLVCLLVFVLCTRDRADDDEDDDRTKYTAFTRDLTGSSKRYKRQWVEMYSRANVAGSFPKRKAVGSSRSSGSGGGYHVEASADATSAAAVETPTPQVAVDIKQAKRASASHSQSSKGRALSTLQKSTSDTAPQTVFYDSQTDRGREGSKHHRNLSTSPLLQKDGNDRQHSTVHTVRYTEAMHSRTPSLSSVHPVEYAGGDADSDTDSDTEALHSAGQRRKEAPGNSTANKTASSVSSRRRGDVILSEHECEMQGPPTMLPSAHRDSASEVEIKHDTPPTAQSTMRPSPPTLPRPPSRPETVKRDEPAAAAAATARATPSRSVDGAGGARMANELEDSPVGKSQHCADTLEVQDAAAVQISMLHGDSGGDSAKERRDVEPAVQRDPHEANEQDFQEEKEQCGVSPMLRAPKAFNKEHTMVRPAKPAASGGGPRPQEHVHAVHGAASEVTGPATPVYLAEDSGSGYPSGSGYVTSNSECTEATTNPSTMRR